MKFYYAPVSTYSQKVLLAFYEKGIEFEKSLVIPSEFIRPKSSRSVSRVLSHWQDSVIDDRR